MQRLFLNKEVLKTVESKSEKDLQKFICENWTTLFPDYTLIKDEFPLKGDVHGVGKKGRTDIFAYHKGKHRFTVFELKRDYNENVASQAANYAGFVREHFHKVYVEAKETHGAAIPEMAKIDNKEVDVVLVAKTFSGGQINQAKSSKEPVMLIEYCWFSDDILFFDYVTNAPDDIIVNAPDEDEDDITEDANTWTFSDLDLPVGAELVLTEDKTKKCKVANDTQVEYEGELFSLTALAEKLLQSKVGRTLIRFTYNGTSINNRRKPNREGNKRGTVDWFKTQGWHAIVKGIEQPAEIRKQLQDIVPTNTEPTKEHIPQLREILKQRVFHVTRRAALLELLDELEKQD